MARRTRPIGRMVAVFFLVVSSMASRACADTQSVYITDFTGKIFQIEFPSSQSGALTLPTDPLQGAFGMAAESATSLLVSSLIAKAILRVDTVNGTVDTVSSGNLILHPEGLVLLGTEVFVADSLFDGIVAVKTTSGAQRVVCRHGPSGGSSWLCAGADGFLYASVNATTTIVRVNPFTGAEVVIAAGGMLSGVGGIGYGADGQLYVACRGFNRIVRVNPLTGVQSVLSAGLNLVSPTGLAIGPEGYVFVTCGSSSQVVRINPLTAAQTVFSVSGMMQPLGIVAVGTPGTLVQRPSAPVSCSATDDRPDSVIFRWVPGPGQTDSFRIVRDSTVLASVASSVTRYADKPPLGPHIYCVSAVNVAGASDSCCDAGQIDLSAVAPHLEFVRDVPDDQGGKVILGWTASSLDGLPQQVTGYRVWRREAPSDSFETVTDLAAGHLTGYGYTAATLQDSLPGSNPFTAFFVRALTADPGVFYDSNVDSGYSVDNLAPDAPQGAHGAYLASGGIEIQWQRSQATDVSEYRIYRGATPSFIPSELNRIGSTRDTTFVDLSVGSFFYKLSAVDVHGNESGFASVSAGSVAASLPTILSAPKPNPSLSGVDFGYTIGEDVAGTGTAPVRLVLFDTRGKLVRVLASGSQPVGRYQVHWDGNDAHGVRLGTGAYQYRLQVGSLVRSGKVIRL